MKTRTNRPQGRFMTQTEVARRIGCSREHVRRQRDKDNPRRDPTFPKAYRFSRYVVFDSEEVERWHEARSMQTAPRRSVDGDTSLGVLPEQAFPFMVKGIQIHPEKGHAKFLYSLRMADLCSKRYSLASQMHGRSEDESGLFYVNWTPSLRDRLSAYGGEEEERSGTQNMITLVLPQYFERIKPGPYRQTELDRFALLDRVPKYQTLRRLEDALCAEMDSKMILRMLGHQPVLKELGYFGCYGPAGVEPVECSITELLTRSVDDLRGRPDTGEPLGTIGNVVRATRRHEQGESVDTAASEGEEVRADAAYLRAMLSEAWHIEALADVGMSCELDSDTVRLSFTDPCEAHQERLSGQRMREDEAAWEARQLPEGEI